MERITQLPPLPSRPADGNKGMFGRVLIVGGNDEMIGAPALAGKSALRAGAGLVQIAVPQRILAAALAITPELIGLALPKGTGKAKLLEAAEKADAVVVGPGLGRSPNAEDRVERLVRLEKAMVIDADALNILAAGKKWPAYVKASAVLTPHPGEMARLGKLFGRTEVPKDEEGRISIAIEAAKTFQQVIVLKGKGTVITDGVRVYINTTGDSSLSKAGTGDVLSGIVGTFLAEKMDHFDAACAAVWIHGRAGEIAGQKLGTRCVLAHDVIDALPAAIAEYEKAQ
ncbi:MAG TPA: NAD(P)H-hydrate dehydratase [Tepidisphaeraceae bacterium]|jgi:NAD(P)H-hydrate epimerase|nr:NAD(P)H-hydrate dehydratase [Tepidisphaeraceae bacterium]